MTDDFQERYEKHWKRQREAQQAAKEKQNKIKAAYTNFKDLFEDDKPTYIDPLQFITLENKTETSKSATKTQKTPVITIKKYRTVKR